MSQPFLGNNYMLGNSNFNGRALPTLSNPITYNYPKIPNFKGSQYSTYPKFKQEDKNIKISGNIEKTKEINSLKSIEYNDISEKTAELKNKLMSELEILEKITEKAKKIIDIPGIKLNSTNIENSNKTEFIKNDNTAISNVSKVKNSSEIIKKDENNNEINNNKDKQNIEIEKIKFNLSKEEKNRFNNKMKEIMNKLSKIK